MLSIDNIEKKEKREKKENQIYQDNQDWKIIEEIRKISSINIDLNKKIQDDKAIDVLDDKKLNEFQLCNDDKSTLSINTMNTNINSSQDSKETIESKCEIKSTSDITEPRNNNNNTDSNDNVDTEDKKGVQKYVYLLKSIYKDRPKTLMFNYLKSLEIVRNNGKRVVKIKNTDKISLKFKISESHRYNCVISNLKKCCFKESKNEKFNFMWMNTCRPE